VRAIKSLPQTLLSRRHPRARKHPRKRSVRIVYIWKSSRSRGRDSEIRGFPLARKGATLYPASPIASRNAKVFCSRGRGIIYRGGESNPGMISGSIHSAGELREYYPSKRNTIRVSMHSNEHSSRPLDGFISNQRSHAATLSLRRKSKMRRACAARQRKIWIFPNEDTVANAIAFVSAKMLKLNVINFHVYYCRVH